MKKLVLLTICLLGSACADQKVVCHGWTPAEKAQLKAEVKSLPDNTPLHGLVRDYERVCADLQ